MSPPPRRPARLPAAIFGGALGALAVGAFEGARLDGAPSPLDGAGLVAPFGPLVGLAVGIALAVADPGGPPALRRAVAALRSGADVPRRERAAMLLAGPSAALAFVLAAAWLARRLFALPDARAAAIVLALGSFVALGAAGAFVLAVAAPLGRLLGRARSLGLSDPLVALALGLGLAAGTFAYGVSAGDPGGDGAAPFGILGVLRRGELDLRPVAALAAVAAFALAAERALARRAARAAFALVVLGLSATAAVVRPAKALGRAPEVGRAFERDGALARIALKVLRKATDRDHDGYSALFGGGDCNDRDPRVSPEALDVPGNGLDEDCSGEDTPLGGDDAPRRTEAEAAAAAKLVRPYNVILVTIDTLRADVGFLGYPKPVTPNLDKLAETSVVFERAYALASYTGKSVGPMLIGKYPSETERNFSHFNTYAPKNVLLAERLKAAGFRTLAAHCHFYFQPWSGLTQGFDVWDVSAKPPTQEDNDTTVSSDRMADVALRLLGDPANVAAVGDDGATKPFFAWFHFFDPHAQYVRHAGAPDFLEGQTSASAKTRALYDEEVWFTDKHVGRILDFVASQPWGAQTAIVVTADHGEGLGDHGVPWHGMELWEPLVRVPWLVHAPGVPARRVAERRSHVDLVPTVLELAGIGLPDDGSLSGRSLVPDMLAPEGAELEVRDTYVDMPVGPYNGVRRALLTGPGAGTKLVDFGAGQVQLFDLAADPGERTDLARDRARLDPVLARLRALRGRLHEIDVKKPAGGDTPSP